MAVWEWEWSWPVAVDLTTGVGIGVSTPQLPGASPLRLHEAEARVSVCNRRGSGECQCAIGEEAALVLPSVSVIESNTAAAAEWKAGCRTIDNQE